MTRKPSQETTADASVTRQTYGGGLDGTEVTLWTIQGGGHEWPGWAPAVRRPEGGSSTVNATELIWEFFAAHPCSP